MELQQVDPVGLEPAQGLLELCGRSLSVAAVDLGHQQHSLPVAVPQRFAHADFARAVVIVPAVVQEINAVVDGGANNAKTLLLVSLLTNVIAAQADNRDLLSSPSQGAVWHSPSCFNGPCRGANTSSYCCGDRQFQEFSPGHQRVFPPLPASSLRVFI